jgi:hypothetical protein
MKKPAEKTATASMLTPLSLALRNGRPIFSIIHYAAARASGYFSEL